MTVVRFRRSLVPKRSITLCQGRLRLRHGGIVVVGPATLWLDTYADQWGGYLDSSDQPWVRLISGCSSVTASCGYLRRAIGTACVLDVKDVTRDGSGLWRVIVVGTTAPAAWFVERVTG